MKYSYYTGIDFSRDVANELAEMNRLTRLKLEAEFKTNAYNNLFKVFKDKDGHSFTVPPSEEDKEKYKSELSYIDKVLQDGGIENNVKEKIKELRQKLSETTNVFRKQLYEDQIEVLEEVLNA